MNIKSIALAMVSTVLFILTLQQINAQDKLLKTYAQLEASQRNGCYTVQAELIKKELPKSKKNVSGNLQILFSFTFLFLVYANLARRRSN